METTSHPESPLAALAKAVAALGSQSAMARLLGISQPAVSGWIKERKLLPAQHVLAVEAATGVSRHDLRPDLYPHEEPSKVASLPLRGVIGSCDPKRGLQLGVPAR